MASARAIGGGPFWRYNYQILAGTGYWILAIPVAASQVITLWMMALQTEFGQEAANRIAEMMTPILGAFLVSYTLAPEYRSGVGAVLACKPLSLQRILVMRVVLGILGAVGLSLVTLVICSVGLKPISIWPPLLASLPSLFFLCTLALLFATMFRSPLAGFGMALGIWSLDYALGYSVHPLLSMQGYTTAESDPLARTLMPAGKGVQILAGVIFWWLHGHLLPRICRPPERKDVSRIVAACGAALLVYCVSGAATVVTYAYIHRGSLPGADVTWLSRQFQLYGPVPVKRLFGPAFVTYLEPAPAPTNGGSLASVRQTRLEQALTRWPHSIWADSIAYAAAIEQGLSAPARTLGSQAPDPRPNAAKATVPSDLFFRVADRYPTSPFAPKALVGVLRLDNPRASDDMRLLAARRLVSEYPHSRDAERGAEVLDTYHPARTSAQEMLRVADVALAVAPDYLRPGWLLRRAELHAELGQMSEAKRSGEEALAEATRLVTAARRGPTAFTEIGPRLPGLEAARVRAEQFVLKMTAGG